MAQTDAQLPQIVIPNTTTGIDWLTPNNILLSDDQFAVSGGSSQILTVGNFPINLSQGDTVTNIIVGVKGYRGSYNTTLQIFAVDNTSGVDISYPLLPAFQGFDGTNTLYLMPASLFATTWTVNQINNIKIKLIADGELHLDYVQLNVVYTPVSTQTLFYSSLAGLFVVGDTVTGFTSGATATIVSDNGVDQMNITNVNGVFLLGETISGVPSGAVAIVASQFASGSIVVDEFVQAQPFQLAQSMTSTDTVMFLSSFNYPDGSPIAYADFYGDAMLVIDQGVPDKEENVQITAVDQNFQGTGLVRLSFSNLSNRGLQFKYPYTTDANLRQDHSGTAEVVISNNAPFYNRFLKRSQIDALISAPITIKDEGVTKTTALHTMDFVGSGVTATLTSPNTIRVNIPGGGGSGITLQTDGVANGDQTLLNLVAGTNINLTDNGTGSVTIDATGGGGGGSELTFTVNQAAHGLSVGNIIKSSGVGTEYAKAQADSAINAQAVGIVTSVINVNSFTYSKDAIEYSGAGIPAGTPGVPVYLSPTVAGAMTVTKPVTVGQIVKQLGVLIASSSNLNFSSDYLGQEITTPSGNSNFTVNADETVVDWFTLELPTPFGVSPSPIWTYSFSPTSYPNGTTVSANGGVTMGTTNAIFNMIIGVGDDTIRFNTATTYKMKWMSSPVSPGIQSGVWSFIGFATGANSDNGDITSTTTKRIGFAWGQDGNLYALTCNGSAVSTTLISAFTNRTVHQYVIIVENGVSANFYVDGVLQSTLTTTLPSGGSDVVKIVADGKNGGGGGCGFEYLSNIILSQKLS